MITIVSYSIAFLAAALLVVLVSRWKVRRRSRAIRGLFRFYDGRKICEVDPISVMLSLDAHPEFRMDLDPKRALLDGDQAAMSRLASAVRDAFGVVAFSGPGKSGLTVFECVELLSVFTLYVELQKKSTSPPPISQPSMASTSSGPEPATTDATLATG